MVDTNQRKFKNLSGEEVAVTYRPVIRKTAMEVEYTAASAIVQSVGAAADVASILFSDSKGKDVPSELTKAGKTLFSALPFDTLWYLGETLLDGAIIEAPGRVARLDEGLGNSDYFTDRMEEFVLAIFWGLDVSFPRLFFQLRALRDRFAALFATKGAKPKEPPATSSNGSPDASTTPRPS